MVCNRLPALALALACGFGIAVTQTGCPHPYSGKAERLKKPRRKRGAPEATAGAVTKAAPDVGRCRTNFFDEPVKRRSPKPAKRKAKQADKLLASAEKLDVDDRGELVNEAMDKLVSALDKDPYGPLPTYKLAVAYALVNQTGCAVALLERLKALQGYPPVAGEAKRAVKQARRDIAFDDFREEADGALKDE